MIQYRTGKWGLSYVFSWRGSVFPKAAALAVPCSVLCVCFRLLLNEEETVGSRILGAGDVGSSVLANFTFVLGFLTVFRSQQAYSRWWEAGRLMMKLRGEWFNAFSSCIAFSDYTPAKRQPVKVFEHELVRLMSLLYTVSLNTLNESDNDVYELIDMSGLDTESLEFLKDSFNPSDVVLQWIQRLVVQANVDGLIVVAPPILSRVFNQLGNGMTILQAARQLNDFRIPFPLAQMITVLMLFHWAMTAIVVATSVQSTAWAGIISFVVTFSFWGVHYIGEELEQPFGNDANDLPIHIMQRDLNSSLREILDHRARHPPPFVFDPEVHSIMPLRDAELGAYVNELIAREKHEEKPAPTPRSADRRKTQNVVSNEIARQLGTTLSNDSLVGTAPLRSFSMMTTIESVPCLEEKEEDESQNASAKLASMPEVSAAVVGHAESKPHDRGQCVGDAPPLREVDEEAVPPGDGSDLTTSTSADWAPSLYVAPVGRQDWPGVAGSALYNGYPGRTWSDSSDVEKGHVPEDEEGRSTCPGSRWDTSRL